MLLIPYILLLPPPQNIKHLWDAGDDAHVLQIINATKAKDPVDL